MYELHFQHRYFFRCRVDILIVVDADIGYGTAGFDLGHVLDALATDPWSHVDFNVTKAHRQSSSDGSVIDNFRFDSHDLSQYSQIWLFGYHDTEDALSPAELKAISQFMDNGGGVFATGDHQDLGQALCAEIPRVRSMRRWYYPNPGPNGEPVAPGQTDASRIDTVMMPGSQGDEIPQPVRLRYYSRKVGGNNLFYQVQTYPHPVMCGPDGPIEVMPDHMHEGLCEVPSNLSDSVTFDGYTTAEYPHVSGHQETPQIVAWGTDRNSGGTEFGMINAYDGHRAGVGRVLVDSTWHHWFNINLNGFVDASNPAHPSYDAAVVPQWQAIQAYFRNVGVWLARESIQSCLRNGGLLIATQAYEVVEAAHGLSTGSAGLSQLYYLGVSARDALGRLASQCQTTRWVLDVIQWPEWHLDPWWIIPRPLPDPPPWLSIEDLEMVSLGGAIHALREKFGAERDLEKLVMRGGTEIAEVARYGALDAARELLQSYRSCGEQAAKVFESLRAFAGAR